MIESVIKSIKFTSLFALILSISAHNLSAQESWYIGTEKSEVEGGSATKTLSIDKVMELSSTGDTIYVLPGREPLVGQIRLKKRQSLIGISHDGRVPVISNPNDSISGFGVVLSSDNLVENLTIDSTYKSGVYGENSTGITLKNLTVSHSNLSGSINDFQIPELPITLTHGGVVLVNNEPGVFEFLFSQLNLDHSAGTNASFIAVNGAKVNVRLDTLKINGGKDINVRAGDVGLGFFADSPQSEITAEVINSSISGRRSSSGRNVVVIASRKGVARILINESYVGVCGQDGVVGVGAYLPAKVDIEIRNSIIEKAAQMNIEGTLLNLPVYDSTQLNKTEMKIAVLNSTVKDPGKEIKFRTPGINIGLGGTNFMQQMNPESRTPLAFGQYVLTVQDSEILNSQMSSLLLGFYPEINEKEKDKSKFDVLIENSRFLNNSTLFLEVLNAPNLNLIARNICWDYNPEFTMNGVVLKDGVGLVDESLGERLNIKKSEDCEE